MLRGILDTSVTSTSRDCILLAKAGETAAVVYRQRLPQKGNLPILAPAR
jgi:hypothetical protein